MTPDQTNSPANNVRSPGSLPPLITGPPALPAAPPPLPAESIPRPSPGRHFLAGLLNVFLGLYLADALISVADDSLSLWCNVHLLSLIRIPAGLLAMLMAAVVYGLMALTPLIPKRFFLPLTLWYLAAMLLTIPGMIYDYGRIQAVVWVLSLLQLALAAGIVVWIGGFKFRWPLLPYHRLTGRSFGWGNLCGFVLANLFLLAPAILVYLVVCGGLAVDHFSEGFVALHPGGLTVQARKYVRNDGKRIELFPMSHVAEADFYEKISQTFPTNSLILMEGVTDTNNLITNGISYKRMAMKLGLSEQHEKFDPDRGTRVRADIDVSEFSKSTIDLLNVIMRFHAKGFDATNFLALMQSTAPPAAQEQLMDDILHKRSQHLLGEINSRLKESDDLMVPWGAAHIPEVAAGILKAGFRLEETRDYEVIRFHFLKKAAKPAKPVKP